MNKVTIYGDPDGWIIGTRAAKKLMDEYPDSKDIVVRYSGAEQFHAYAKKNKAGVSVWVTKKC